MPYIPPQNRPAIDKHVDALAERIADVLDRRRGRRPGRLHR